MDHHCEWTTDKPTRPGRYLWQCDPHGPVFVVEVRPAPAGSEHPIAFHPPVFEDVGGRWRKVL